jgi:alkylated DNA repair dioxygenase AlkB
LIPEGFVYEPDVITDDEARALVDEIRQLDFTAVEMRGVVARRRTVHFGWNYSYYSRRTEPGPTLPAFLLPVRERVAARGAITPETFVEALVTEYPPGAAIGWHRDAPMFGDVIGGLSLLTPARMKFRPYVSPSDVPSLSGPRKTTHEIDLEPRSLYLMTGVARRDFEHSIPGVSALRYSITFRTLRAR